MTITHCKNEDKEFSFLLSAKFSDLLTVQGFFMDILNEFHFRQVPDDSPEIRSQIVFIKKAHVPKLKSWISQKNYLESDLTTMVRQIVFEAERQLLVNSDLADPVTHS